MADENPDSSHSDLDRLGHKIDAARKDSAPKGPAPQASGLGIAFRLATELVAAVVVGVGIGWLLDAWTGWGPTFLLVFFALGVVAGFFNVIRASRELEAKRNK